ncbi:MAG TPA: hypothetical protein DCQ31_10505 [Bacteroidales bacterium]|nr:hypothetical protein [Bacteroidales bacterium]
MNALTDEDIDFIYNDVRQKGISLEMLLDEMVDHICCTLEPALQKGVPFVTAYHDFINSLENDTFKNLQHQTILSTDLKFQKMKKSMFFTGFFGTLVLVSGVFFKINHWPGAGILMVLGMLLVALVFLPLFFITSYKEQETKKNVLLFIIGYITLAFLLLGPLFKVMHWPFANVLLFYGPISLAVVFLPTYLVSIFRKANETKTNFIFLIILIGIGLSSLFSLSAVNISKTAIDRYDSEYRTNLQVYSLVSEKSDSIFDAASEEKKQKAQTLKNASNELNSFIDQLMLDMIKNSNSGEVTLNDFSLKDDKKACRTVLETAGNYEKLLQLLQNYRNAVRAIPPQEIDKIISTNSLKFNLLESENEVQVFKQFPLIEALATLSAVKKNVAIAKYEALQTIE